MAKVADKYFKADEWKVIEEGFNPDYGEVSESIFSLGNEYLGARGYFDEGYSGSKLIGSYFNGIYEMTKPEYGHYKGIADFTEFMVNSVDWLYTRIEIDGEQLDLATSEFEDFVREIDMKTGILTRSFVWKTKSGKRLAVKFERFVSMTQVKRTTQKITIKPIGFSGKIYITSGLDFSQIHKNERKNLWDCKPGTIEKGEGIFMGIDGTTINTKLKVYSSCKVNAEYESLEEVNEEKIVAVKLKANLEDGKDYVLTKVTNNVTLRDDGDLAVYDKEVEAVKSETETACTLYDKLEKENIGWWKKVWDSSDITIANDLENQQGIRFCIFQMYQTYHGAVEGTNIGAKGLTGEAYNGNAFWDTETYCLPFFIFNNQEAARNLLYFRYKTLDEARKRAEVLDCKGAFYPIATISGRECCNLWQHASLQLQASTAVAYGVWFYEKMFDDKDFLKKYGLEMLIEISRMLATRGDFNREGKYGYYCVMGPDEFQMMVHNNSYTNYMAKFTLEYTLDKINEIKSEDPDAYKKVAEKVAFDESEMDTWKNIKDNMILLYDDKTKLFEQHDGFFKLPHLDVDSIPISDFPLYDNWSYDRIYRNDMIKQPDVLMFMLLFISKFSQEQLKANYEYYEPCCIHESSLSPSVHSILASQLHKKDEAYDFFGFATRLDLDNYNRNTNQGIHTTSIAAAWMNIVYGFGGLRSDGEKLSVAPSIPKNWGGYSFNISYKGVVIEIKVDKENVYIKTKGDGVVELSVYGKDVEINSEGYKCEVE